jgi:hypothetical protein
MEDCPVMKSVILIIILNEVQNINVNKIIIPVLLPRLSVLRACDLSDRT